MIQHLFQTGGGDHLEMTRFRTKRRGLQERIEQSYKIIAYIPYVPLQGSGLSPALAFRRGQTSKCLTWPISRAPWPPFAFDHEVRCESLRHRHGSKKRGLPVDVLKQNVEVYLVFYVCFTFPNKERLFVWMADGQ